jgi:hypothetical protein
LAIKLFVLGLLAFAGLTFEFDQLRVSGFDGVIGILEQLSSSVVLLPPA